MWMHESSYMSDNVEVGEGTKIWHFSFVSEGVRIGTDCSIGQHAYIGPNVVIGNGVKIKNNVSIYEDVTIEDDVFIGPSVVFTNIANPRSFMHKKRDYSPTLVSIGASIGANSTIMCGNTIGRYALVGAGSVVTKSIPDYWLCYGVPAKFQAWICRCGAKLESVFFLDFKCQKCDTTYRATGRTMEKGLVPLLKIA